MPHDYRQEIEYHRYYIYTSFHNFLYVSINSQTYPDYPDTLLSG